MKKKQSQKRSLKPSQATDLDFSKYDILAKKAERLHFSILKKSIEAFNEAVELGKILHGIKTDLPHGQFTKFISEKVNFISDRTAQRYMQFYQRENEIRVALGELLDISSATKFLSSMNNKGKGSTTIPKKTIDTINDFQVQLAKSKSNLRKSIKSGTNLLAEDEKKILATIQPKSFKRVVTSLENQLKAIDILEIPEEDLEPSISVLTDILRELENRRKRRI